MQAPKYRSYLSNLSEAACGSGGAEPESAANDTLRSRQTTQLVVEGGVLKVSDEEEFGVFPAESELPGYSKGGVALEEGSAFWDM